MRLVEGAKMAIKKTEKSFFEVSAGYEKGKGFYLYLRHGEIEDLGNGFVSKKTEPRNPLNFKVMLQESRRDSSIKIEKINKILNEDDTLLEAYIDLIQKGNDTFVYKAIKSFTDTLRKEKVIK
jgi:hypothetical protein